MKRVFRASGMNDGAYYYADGVYYDGYFSPVLNSLSNICAECNEPLLNDLLILEERCLPVNWIGEEPPQFIHKSCVSIRG